MELLTVSEHQQIQRKSLGITTVIALVVLLISIFTTFIETTDPPLYEVLSEGSGSVDFGNWVEGSGKVNNFEDPSPNLGEGKAQNTSVKTETTQEKQTLSGEAEDEDVVAPKKEENKIDKPKETPKETKNSQETHSGGSNHGDGDKIGNRGRNDVKVLDIDGLYTFGNGDEGLQGRRPISLPKPVYEVEAEARITYRFTIAPNGSVKNVKALTLSTNSELTNAGIKAIYKWKFEPIETEKIQTTQVTITFRLK